MIPKGYRAVASFREMQFDEGAQMQALEMMQGFMDSPLERDGKSRRSKKNQK